jgi:beta-lactamase superfamily II metal-dependent hydrolase
MSGPPKRFFVIALLVAVGVIAAVVLYLALEARIVLRVYLPDVDQGAFVVVVDHSGQVAIFDCGSGTNPTSNLRLRDILEVIAVETSDDFSELPRLALLSVSHLHNDHLNLLESLHSEVSDSSTWELNADLIYLAPEPISFGESQREVPSLGSSWNLDSLVIKAVHAAPAKEWNVKDNNEISENNDSSAFALSLGSFDFWVGGDLCDGSAKHRTFCTQAAMLGDVDVYVANHSGDPEASPPAFLRCIRPELVVVQQSGGRMEGKVQELWDNLTSIQGFEGSGFLLLQNLGSEDPLDELPSSQKRRTYVAEIGPTDEDALNGAMRIDVTRGLFGMHYKAYSYDQGWHLLCQRSTDGHVYNSSITPEGLP